jgi:hypothetical protein
MAFHISGVGFGRRTVSCIPLSVLAIGLVACMARVDGERASTGECPAGEVCSQATEQGLHFIGHAFFDDSDTLLLGPVMVGGTFELGIKTADGGPLPEFAFEAEDGTVFDVELGNGQFGPTVANKPLYRVDSHLALTGLSEGRTNIRITDADTGELFDRIAIDAYEISDIELSNMNDPGREYVIGGCDELLAVRLVATNGTREIRGFDQSLSLRAEGSVSAEPQFWDCFRYAVPEGKAEVEIEVEAASRVFTKTVEVRTLADVELSACPEMRRSRD